MQIRFSHAVGVIAAVGIIITLILVSLSNFQVPLPAGFKPNISGNSLSAQSSGLASIQHFSSEAEFKAYLEKSRDLSIYNPSQMLGGMIGNAISPLATDTLKFSERGDSGVPTGSTAAQPERVSETNVQVAGIDEPDSVKTDGNEIYYSSESNVVYPMTDMPMSCATNGGSDCAVPPARLSGQTKNIKAFPVEKLSIDVKIEKSGNLLLRDNMLVILPQNLFYSGQPNKILGYDVSDPTAPKEKWTVELKDSNQLVAARLFQDKIYIVTKKTINEAKPCPFEPLTAGGKTMSVGCIEIYHPVAPVPMDVTYTITALDAMSGEARDTTTFVGSGNDSAIYMSPDAVYLTYYYPGDFVKFAIDFFKENSDLIPSSLVDKIEKLKGYDIGASAKITEFSDILEKYQSSLSNDEKMKLANEMQNRMQEYFSDHKRDLEKTGIAKISADTLNVEASGVVPGKTLNQFSLDEYKERLRVATTVGERWWGFGFGGTRDSANDVYILDKELRVSGALTDLGQDEKIYSARFIGDKGYLVTFRQTDPFFVLNLADPQNPRKSGELKIPGYSSYLHPISADRILGIGSENNQVKVSLFDVSSAENPREASKYNLDEYWTEAANNHHAFLLDAKHQAFFLPGGQGGYIFSYAGDNLKLVKTVADIRAKRAVYINDYLYVIGDDKIVVLNENNWDKAGELAL